MLLDDCAADPGCAAAYPQLETQLYRLINRLNSNPITFDVYDHTTGQATAVVDGGRLLEWIDWAFYSCIAATPGPEFVLPQDVFKAPGIYRVTFNVGQSGFEETLYMICLLIFVAEIGLLIVSGIMLLVRRRERIAPTDRIARLALPLAGLVAGLNLGLAVALAPILNSLVETHRLLLRFGVPSEYAVSFVILVVTAVLTVALVFFAMAVWVRSNWSVAQRVFFSVITLGAVIFTGLMAYWDLMALPLWTKDAGAEPVSAGLWGNCGQREDVEVRARSGSLQADYPREKTV